MGPSGSLSLSVCYITWHVPSLQKTTWGEVDNPGPGSYDYQEATGGVDPMKRPSSAFKSGSQRLGIEDAQQGDPGAYDPYAQQELAQTTKATFAGHQRARRNGVGGTSGLQHRGHTWRPSVWAERTMTPPSCAK